jgi:hypothetical protein
MDSKKTATAAFTLAPKCVLDLENKATTGSDTLQTAYNRAASTIFALTGLFLEEPLIDPAPSTAPYRELLFDQVKNIVLKGGYLADYGTTRSGFSILVGKLTIKAGSLRVDSLKIRP